MTREEAINKLNWALNNNTIENVQSAYDYIMAIKMAIEVLKQDPCEDAISRQAAIDAMIKIEQDDSGPAIEALNNLPSVPLKIGWMCMPLQELYKAESEVES